MSAPRILKPGKGTLAALRHICPHCNAGQGVRCTTPTGEARMFVHARRMDLARDAIAKAGGTTS